MIDECEKCCYRHFAENNVDFFDWMWQERHEQLKKLAEEYKKQKE